MPCRHPDVRKFDGVRCCLACGEAVFEVPQLMLAAEATSLEVDYHYRYAELNSTLGQEIRIVVLLPGRRTDPLRCDIIHVTLEDVPNFEAVSYTWATEEGDDSKSEVVYHTNGAKIPVTVNCAAVLCQLRLLNQKRRLWVDALCINQINLSERNHQVGLMHMIYHGARNVLVSIPSLRLEWTVETVPVISLKQLFEWLRGTTLPTAEHERSLRWTCEKLFKARYFQRVWIIQEVALGRNVVLCVNNEAVDLSFPVMERLRSTQQVPAVLRWNPGLIVEADVLFCLRAGLESYCSDARDQVYAVLSLMEPHARSLIPVDYSLDLHTIYSNALLAVMATYGNLEVLTYALLESPWNDYVRYLAITPIVTLKSFAMYISSNGMSASLELSALTQQQEQWDNQTATLWRPKITVRTTSMLDAYIDECTDPDEPVVMFEQICTVSPICLFPRFKTRAHFTDTIIWHQDFEGGEHLRNSSTSMRLKSCAKILPFFSRRPHPQPPFFELHPDLHPNDVLTEQNAPDLNIQDLRSFVRILKKAGSLMLFTTHYSVGLADGPIRPGDAVYVLDGARAPFVLRKAGLDQYRIVTVCYLWSALRLDYWNPGTKKGLWGTKHHDHECEQTQTIVVH